MWNAELDEAEGGITFSNLRYADDNTLMVESEEELKSFLMKVRGEWKSWLKTKHSKKQWSWHLVPSLYGKSMGKHWEPWKTLFSWAPRSLQMVTAAMKSRPLLLGRKAMTNLDSVLKSRDITLLKKVHIVKAMVYPVVMYGSDSWTVKKAECLRIDAFELWCWRRLLRIPCNARRSNQLILKDINPEYSLEGLMLKLKLQYFGHQMWRAD